MSRTEDIRCELERITKGVIFKKKERVLTQMALSYSRAESEKGVVYNNFIVESEITPKYELVIKGWASYGNNKDTQACTYTIISA